MVGCGLSSISGSRTVICVPWAGAVTTVTIVLDGALIGVQQSGRQVSRNLVFSLVKLIALPLAALAIGLSPQVIFSAWLLGNLISLLILVLLAARAVNIL